MILQRLHCRVSQTYNPDPNGGNLDRSVIASLISSTGISSAVSLSIAQQLSTSRSSMNANITGLRVSIMHPFARDDCFWAVLEWTEDGHIDGLGIFQVDIEDDSDSGINGLIHHGYREKAHSSGRSWVNTLISWTVTSLGQLKSLFGAARHILGILELPFTDSIILYCETEEPIASEDEYDS
jgi:hypothetical protein